MPIDTRFRSQQAEIMDDFDLEGPELEKALVSIARINQLLGGNRLTLKAVDKLAAKAEGPLSILDLGCGNGDMLRELDKLAQKKGYQFNLTGVDANAFTIKSAEELSKGRSNIQYQCADFMKDDFDAEEYDIILLTLTLHHLTDAEILRLLNRYRPNTRLAIVVNDLERSSVAYYLFSLFSKIFGLNAMNDSDGKLSILRGFKRRELRALAQKLNFKHYTIRWKWAFRYQWIISDL